MLWELLAADIERIEGISAVGTVFEKILGSARQEWRSLLLDKAQVVACG